jgi:hypothetical protein
MFHQVTLAGYVNRASQYWLFITLSVSAFNFHVCKKTPPSVLEEDIERYVKQNPADVLNPNSYNLPDHATVSSGLGTGQLMTCSEIPESHTSIQP